MGEDTFAAIGFGRTRNEVVAAAAFELRREIYSGDIDREKFIGMIREVNAAFAQFGPTGQTEEKKSWKEAVADMANVSAKDGLRSTFQQRFPIQSGLCCGVG